jgi:hypothetical protein
MSAKRFVGRLRTLNKKTRTRGFFMISSLWIDQVYITLYLKEMTKVTK